jgi:hypothetical protein
MPQSQSSKSLDMSDITPNPRRWAILVGINFYGKAAKPLRGCVSDVDSIEKHLLGGGVEHVETFKASVPSDPKSSQPDDDSSTWPTYENVTASLRAVTNKARPGDFVHIHFSGHGTQPKGNNSGFVHPGTGDLALVLFHPSTGIRYLHGLELAALLKDMVERSLLVTLVLDCCFSGSVVRHGTTEFSTIRYVDYDAAIDAAYPLSLTPGAYNLCGDAPLRDAREIPRLLIASDRYTILCACGPHEIAEELSLPSCGNRFAGALSHFLLRALKSLRGTKITTQTLYNHLRLKFHVYWPQQTPMCFGLRDLFFLGSLAEVDSTGFVTVLKQPEDNRLYLDAGVAHGVCQGDEYAVYPLAVSKGAQPSFYGRAENVGQLRSELAVTSALSISTQNETRWKAKPLSLPPWEVPVRLMFDKAEDHWGQFEKERPFLQLISQNDKDKSCLFSVSLNASGDYQILDGSRNPIINLPIIPRDEPRAIGDILNILEHLATFKYVEGIENQNPQRPFERSFTIYLEDERGNKAETGGLLTVKHSERVTITVENLGAVPLYLAIFDMGPLWQIDDVLAAEGGAGFRVVTPKKPEDKDRPQYTGIQNIPLEMTVPDTLRSQGRHQCEDILKIFVTSIASSFSALSLPKIHIPIDAADGADRGRAHHHELSAFLSYLSSPFRGPEAGYPDENWTTRSFFVQTIERES